MKFVCVVAQILSINQSCACCQDPLNQTKRLEFLPIFNIIHHGYLKSMDENNIRNNNWPICSFESLRIESMFDHEVKTWQLSHSKIHRRHQTLATIKQQQKLRLRHSYKCHNVCSFDINYHQNDGRVDDHDDYDEEDQESDSTIFEASSSLRRRPPDVLFRVQGGIVRKVTESIKTPGKAANYLMSPKQVVQKEFKGLWLIRQQAHSQISSSNIVLVIAKKFNPQRSSVLLRP